MSKKCSILEFQQINVDQCLLMVELAQANYSSMQQHPHHFFSMEGGSWQNKYYFRMKMLWNKS